TPRLRVRCVLLRTTCDKNCDQRRPMSLEQYVTLGNSGLRVSPFCLGGMTFGEDWGWGSSVQDAEAIMARYIERGGEFLDTADVYTEGQSERNIGELVGPEGRRRDRVVSGPKVFRE